MKIAFIAALFNEQNEIDDLISHVEPYVDALYFVDDGSTDQTLDKLFNRDTSKISIKMLTHTGLPETVKAEALKGVPENYEWVLMLDADERFITPLQEIVSWIKSPASVEVDYVYFNQFEVIDGKHVRTFQKCKLFRRGAINFPLNDIHKDDELRGEGAFLGWQVIHRKTTNKQIQREFEYLKTYDKLLEDGHIDEGRRDWLRNLHHYVKNPHG
jgi:glycosyltransferase involved in cell wall biosynthesis